VLLCVSQGVGVLLIGGLCVEVTAVTIFAFNIAEAGYALK